MLISKRTERIEIPDEHGQWLDIKLMSLGVRESSRQAAQQRQWDHMAAVAKIRASLPSDFLPGKSASKEAAEPSEPDPMDGHDAATLVDGCVVAWSYDEPVSKPSEQLDAATVEWAARTIVEKNTRPPASGPGSSTS